MENNPEKQEIIKVKCGDCGETFPKNELFLIAGAYVCQDCYDQGKQEIETLLNQNQLWDKLVFDELNKVHIGDLKARECVFLCSVGRKVKGRKPYSFNCLILTESSAGKDHLIKGILKLYEEDFGEGGDFQKYSRIGPTTLNYLNQRIKDKDPEKCRNLNFTWSEKILYLPEITNPILNNEIMKEFTSGEDPEEYSRVAITKKESSKEKSFKVDICEVWGKPEVFCSSAKAIPNDEIMNRFNIFGLDLSPEQTLRTFKFKQGNIPQKYRRFLSELKSYEVEIPKNLMDFIINNFPPEKTRARRDFPKFLDFIKAYALFHQDNRDIKKGCVIAEPEDYNRARDIFVNAYSNGWDIPLNDIDKEIIEVLREFKETGTDAKEIHKRIENGEKFALKNMYLHLARLVENGILKSRQERILSGYLVTKYFLTQEYLAQKPFILPIFQE